MFFKCYKVFSKFLSNFPNFFKLFFKLNLNFLKFLNILYIILSTSFVFLIKFNSNYFENYYNNSGSVLVLN